jgi:hypothetical protein
MAGERGERYEPETKRVLASLSALISGIIERTGAMAQRLHLNGQRISA